MKVSKALQLAKTLNDIQYTEDLQEFPGRIIEFKLDSNGKDYNFNLERLKLVDWEYTDAIETEFLKLALEELKSYIDALHHAKLTLEFTIKEIKEKVNANES